MTFSAQLTLVEEGKAATINLQMARSIIGFAAGQVLVSGANIANPLLTSNYETLIDDAYPLSTTAPEETWTLTATSATTFSVSGSISGTTLGGYQSSFAVNECTIGDLYSNSAIQFKILPANIDYQPGDQITIALTNGLRHSHLANYFGAGTGGLSRLESLTAAAETFTLIALSDSSFSVTSSTSGSLADALVNELYDPEFNPLHSHIRFLITPGLTPFAAGDRFTISTAYFELQADERWQVLDATQDQTKCAVHLRGAGQVGVGPAFIGIETRDGAYEGNMLHGSIFRDFVAGAPTHLLRGTTSTSNLPSEIALRITRRNIIAFWNTAGNSYSDQLYLGLIQSFFSPQSNAYPAYIGMCKADYSGGSYPLTVSQYIASGLAEYAGQTKLCLAPGTTTDAQQFTFQQHGSSSPDRPTHVFTGAGNGSLYGFRRLRAEQAYEDVTITATSPTTFSVQGADSGVHADATINVPYRTSATSGWAFTLEEGSTPFQIGDSWVASVDKITLLSPIELRGRGILEGCYELADAEADPGDLVRSGELDYFVAGNLNRDASESYRAKFALRMD